MSRVQRLVSRFVSERTMERIELDSRSWVMDCECGATTSIWEMGGVRYKASSAGKRHRGRCASCGRRVVGRVRRIDLPR
ncbi:MAG: hypothetical protein QNJ12_04515 [Ilumatobacter sp.]|uniref:hypothetical protein n=1 Tax=Ilumatobacter sp. TaxID=1967498 RepID=UPI002628ED02|nr:hypothetical protein [Ilumatobacter sp.]MDJ0768029.1 hypothetical protein [Ilumatobacter sp.]